jgi:protein-disulfide isomerase
MKTLILSLVLLGAAAAAQAKLSADEQSTAQSMDTATRAKYTATREYVHRAEAIINDGANPLTLGTKPSNIDTQYYQGDDLSIVTKARDASNIAKMSGLKILP